MAERVFVTAISGVLVVCAGSGVIAARASSSQDQLPASQDRAAVEEVVIVAERFSFTPSEIRVRRGTTLRLRVRSQDTAHGLRILGTGLNVTVPKRGRGDVVVTFQADEVGEFEFECSKLCGAGHAFMRGAIIVRPEDSDGPR